jgi:serine O-acetyltransferase
LTTEDQADEAVGRTEPPVVPGARNENPTDIGFFELIAEDFRTYDRDLLEPAFWAVALHRFGNWRMGIRRKLLRAPFTLIYRTFRLFVTWLWGIDLCYSVKLGRRVRLWHHGCMVLGAKSIGNDVHIRHCTTFGLVERDQRDKKPVIEDRVDVGVGACILGDITVGHDSVIGANTVVVRDVPPHSTIFGVPGRAVDLKRRSAASPAKPSREVSGSR